MRERVITLALDAHPQERELGLLLFQQFPGQKILNATEIYPVGIHYHILQSMKNTMFSNGVDIHHQIGGICSINMKKHKRNKIRC